MASKGSKPAQDFARVNRILAGATRQPLGAQVSKVLRFMLVSDLGADAEITPAAFVIRFGWHPSRHRYFTHIAPGVVSTLMEWADIRSVESAGSWLLEGRSVPAMPRWPRAWDFGARWAWFVPSSSSLTIHVRAESEQGMATPLPKPIRAKRHVAHLPESLACPHCAVDSREYRFLTSAEAFVCGSCGRSFKAELPVLETASIKEDG